MARQGVSVMKLNAMFLMTAVAASGSCATFAAPPEGAVLLTGDPVVMRLNKDEFRIVFSIEGKSCAPRGCSGSVRYWVDWKASDGTLRSERKEVSYMVSPEAARTIAVDRQYLDTAEGAHTVDVVNVRVDAITRRD
jgi:hypothetical protein